MRQRKYVSTALGCRTNQYEAQGFADQLKEMNFAPAGEGEAADLCIINTCTVTASADASSRSEIRRLKRKYPKAKIVVTGCYADRAPEDVDYIVLNKDKEELLKFVFPDEEVPEFSIKRFEAHTRAFVKIQDGCNSFCTYCIIPYVRGRSRSRSIEAILKEVQDLVSNGYREIVLTGINIGDFDGGGGHTLAELVRLVDQVDGVDRIRISSIDPDEVDDDLLDAVVSGKKTCQSMHIVLQSGSNVVLKHMNRKYTRQMFFDSVERLKSASSDFTFTTDLIVGFPGESERDFGETLDAMERVQFAKVHMFPYSDRPRTRANLYPNKISDDVKKQRKARLMQVAEKHSFDLRQNYVGKEMEVLMESGSSGHTDNFLEVLTEGKSNTFKKVKIVKNTAKGLVGHAL